MKLTTINVQIVRNLGNYESVRLGGEWSVEKEKAADAFAAAEKELLAIAEQLHPRTPKAPLTAQNDATKAPEQPKAKKQTAEEVFPPSLGEGDKREQVGFSTPLLQTIVNRINDANKPKITSIDEITKFYRLSNKAEQVILAAIQFNN